MEKTFKIENFEGPLDLLLHLIRENKLDILELSLAKVADQYIDFINNANEVNLDLASDYLLLSSQLLEIKSRNLMKSEIFNPIKDDYEEDTKELLDRLMRYEKYKQLSESFYEIYLNNPTYEKKTNDLDTFAIHEEKTMVLKTNGTKDLIKAFDNIITRLMQNGPLETRINVTRISQEDRKKEIVEQLDVDGTTLFTSLLHQINKYYIAITLLILLDMVRDGNIYLRQTGDFENIEVIING